MCWILYEFKFEKWCVAGRLLRSNISFSNSKISERSLRSVYCNTSIYGSWESDAENGKNCDGDFGGKIPVPIWTSGKEKATGQFDWPCFRSVFQLQGKMYVKEATVSESRWRLENDVLEDIEDQVLYRISRYKKPQHYSFRWPLTGNIVEVS